jgi:signal transduction histidine kinase
VGADQGAGIEHKDQQPLFKRHFRL